MNKHTMFISFFIISSFLLAACQQEPERIKSRNQEDIPSSVEGITIKLEEEQYTTPDTETKLTLHNNSKTTFIYGKEFLLEKKVNGTWYEISLKEDIGFTAEAYSFASGQRESQTISLDIFSEKLSTGHYRIIKDFLENGKEYRQENQIMIADSFELIEP